MYCERWRILPGILPANLGSEIARVLREIDVIEGKVDSMESNGRRDGVKSAIKKFTTSAPGE
jgi:hypothetical protein